MSDRQRFERAAAPAAIAARIEQSLIGKQRIENDLLWLAGLMRERLRQVNRGEWPPSVVDVEEGGSE